MSLYDHFRPPLSLRRHRHSFHNAWATYIASDLNHRLPQGYFAEANVQFSIEIDVATFEESPPLGGSLHRDEGNHNRRGLGTGWTPPVPVQTVPFPSLTDTVEVTVFNSEAGSVLVGAIELVSPANKDRADHRSAFVSKCETYLGQGVGLVVVDVVTGRKANLHNELLTHIGSSSGTQMNADLYAVAYHLVDHDGEPSLDIWQEALTLGSPLPTMPLWLHGGLCLPVELNDTYERTCEEGRIRVDDPE